VHVTGVESHLAATAIVPLFDSVPHDSQVLNDVPLFRPNSSSGG